MQRHNTVHHGGHLGLTVNRYLLFPHAHDLQGIQEQHPRQVHGHGRHIDARLRIRTGDDGQCPDVVHMGMTDQNRIHAAHVLDHPKIRNRIPVGCLTHARVKKYACIPGPQIYAAAANFHGTARKPQFHTAFPLYPPRIENCAEHRMPLHSSTLPCTLS